MEYGMIDRVTPLRNGNGNWNGTAGHRPGQPSSPSFVVLVERLRAAGWPAVVERVLRGIAAVGVGAST
jgi:hypothetical protein